MIELDNLSFTDSDSEDLDRLPDNFAELNFDRLDLESYDVDAIDGWTVEPLEDR
jgi:hypothetical protein